MRLYPPVWGVGRQAVEDVELGGHRVPAGAELILSSWVMQRDGRWFRDPERFDPDRWENETAIPRGAYFPFSAGPRGCIGQQFAMMEATLALAAIAAKFRLTLLPDYPVVPWVTMTLRPRDGVRVRIARREER
jgi:cytochrome P450